MQDFAIPAAVQPRPQAQRPALQPVIAAREPLQRMAMPRVEPIHRIQPQAMAAMPRVAPVERVNPQMANIPMPNSLRNTQYNPSLRPQINNFAMFTHAQAAIRNHSVMSRLSISPISQPIYNIKSNFASAANRNVSFNNHLNQSFIKTANLSLNSQSAFNPAFSKMAKLNPQLAPRNNYKLNNTAQLNAAFKPSFAGLSDVSLRPIKQPASLAVQKPLMPGSLNASLMRFTYLSKNLSGDLNLAFSKSVMIAPLAKEVNFSNMMNSSFVKLADAVSFNQGISNQLERFAYQKMPLHGQLDLRTSVNFTNLAGLSKEISKAFKPQFSRLGSYSAQFNPVKLERTIITSLGPVKTARLESVKLPQSQADFNFEYLPSFIKLNSTLSKAAYDHKPIPNSVDFQRFANQSQNQPSYRPHVFSREFIPGNLISLSIKSPAMPGNIKAYQQDARRYLEFQAIQQIAIQDSLALSPVQTEGGIDLDKALPLPANIIQPIPLENQPLFFGPVYDGLMPRPGFLEGLSKNIDRKPIGSV
ncbi:MAG: hypothetical protein ABH872_00720 [Candidatus Omnitrophota bacterium]